MTRLWTFLITLLATLLVIVPASAQAPPHIQAAYEFLLGWGKADWDAVKAHAADRVAVKVGSADYALDVAGKKAEVQLVFPFRGLAAVRVGANVKGVTVEEITVRAGGAERKGKGTVTLEEKDGTFTVTSVAVE
jgi:hypothetical protein